MARTKAKNVVAGQRMAQPQVKRAVSVKTPSTFSQYKTLLRKDLEREFRTREMTTSMGIYALLVLIVYGAAVSQASSDLDVLQIAGGLFWALVVFTSLLGLNRSFACDKEQGCLEGILLVPLDRSVVFLAKATSNLLFLLAIEVIAVPLFFFFFLTNVELGAQAPFALLVLLAGSIGIAGVGTLLSTITVNTRGKDVMLAVLFIPLIFPLLYACVAATTAVLVGAEGCMDVFATSMAMACGYDVVMVLLGWVLYDFVISA